jgi:putative peptidoglycan lipid II flippase
LLIAAGFGAVNIALALALMGPLGHGGLALANSVAVSAEVLVLLLVLRRRLGGVEGRETLQMLGRVLLAAAAMSAAVGGVVMWGERTGLGALRMTLAGAATGILVYTAAALLLGVREIYRLPAALLRPRPVP